MNELAKEYGAALFMLAYEKGETENFFDSLELIKNALVEEPEYLSLISSPNLTKKEKHSLIESAFSVYINGDVLSFLLMLCDRNRMFLFYDAADEFERLLNESKKIVCAKVTSAIELTEGQKEKLKEKLQNVYNSVMRVDYFVDKTILGGIIVEFDGKVLDGSVASTLGNVKDGISV